VQPVSVGTIEGGAPSYERMTRKGLYVYASPKGACPFDTTTGWLVAARYNKKSSSTRGMV